ncbi:hypothetical protein KY306_02945, partial [Candidatus Woesearchaeota archaeon]|nr:hypothetical protein [Candidatus Woesearchaeota archaeon]
AERRAAKYEQIIEEDLTNLMEKLKTSELSSGEINKLPNLIKQLQMYSRILLKNVSIYEGKLKKEIEYVRIEAALEEKEPGEKIEMIVEDMLRKISSELDDLLTSVAAVESLLEKAKEFVGLFKEVSGEFVHADKLRKKLFGYNRYVHHFKKPKDYPSLVSFWASITPLSPSKDYSNIFNLVDGVPNGNKPVALVTPEGVPRKGLVYAIEIWEKDGKVVYGGIYGLTTDGKPQGKVLETAKIAKKENEKIQFAFSVHHGAYNLLFDMLGRKGKLIGNQPVYITFPFSFPNDLIIYPRNVSEALAARWTDSNYLRYSIQTKKLLKSYLESVMEMRFKIRFSIVENALK